MSFTSVNNKIPVLNAVSVAVEAAARVIRNGFSKRSASDYSSIGRGDTWSEAMSLGSSPRSVEEAVRKLSMGFTRSVSGLDTDVDLNAGDFPFIFDAIKQFAEVTGERVYLLRDDGDWKDISDVRFSPSILKPSKSGYVELAIAKGDHRLTGRLSINLWRQVAGGLEATGSRAPVKKTMNVGGTDDDRSDAFIEPIDAVYTWVNSDDAHWRDMIAPYQQMDRVDQDRFAQIDELRYSIRSLFTFAPWIRKVFVFTNCAPPEWFTPSERVQWVMHSDVIPERYLPLFNSHAIETFLHEIPGLSERYVYFNDDVFISAPVRPTDFFNAYGHSVSRMEPCGAIKHLRQVVRTDDAEEWQHAAVNCANLMFETTGVLPSKLHCHVPHAYMRAVYSDLAETFHKQLEKTRIARFRQKTDYSFSSFLYHHFALWRGRAAHVDETAMVVRASNYERFLSKRLYRAQRFFCLNDGGGSAADAEFRKFKQTFLTKQFAFKSPAEA
jgi:hypothetical protein